MFPRLATISFLLTDGTTAGGFGYNRFKRVNWVSLGVGAVLRQ